jgi:hypothetical protein
MAVMLVAATLTGASAFAESRPSEGTRSRRDAGATVRRGTVSARGAVGRGNESRNESRNRATIDRRSSRGAAVAPRASAERRGSPRAAAPGREGRTYERRGDGRTYERGPDVNNDSRKRNESYRRGDRNRSGSYGRGYDNNRGYNNRGYNNRGYNNRGYGSNNHRYGNSRPYYHHGRISKYHRYGGGYRVWIAGAPYPFYVPLAYWHPSRFRIGLSIGLGGYYNSAGYYDYYDGYRDGYRDSYRRNLNSEGDFRGVVESVDWRRDTFVVRNEATGNFITVVLRDRREETVRPGDYVEVRGDWTTRGYFHAYDVDLLD